MCMVNCGAATHLWSRMICCKLCMQNFTRTLFHNIGAFFTLSTNFEVSPLQYCDRMLRISEIVLKMGAKNSLWCAQEQAICFCNDFSRTICKGRWWFVNTYHYRNETQVPHRTPESKQQSMAWRHTTSPMKKFIQTKSTRKTMYIVFWDREGILLVEFLPRNETINKE